MHAPSLCTPTLLGSEGTPLTNVGQMFNRNGAAFRCSTHDLFAQHVIAATAEPYLLMMHLPQAALLVPRCCN